MQATCQNERVGAQRREPLLLGAPPRVRNQIEMGEKPPSNIFNLHSRPKGGDHQSGTPFGLFSIISISMKRGGDPPLWGHLHSCETLAWGAIFSSKVTLGT